MLSVRHSLPSPRRPIAPRSPRGAGVTVLELVVTLAVLSALLAVGAARVLPATSRVAASSVQSAVVQARFQALKLNRPVVVELDPEAGVVTAWPSKLAGSIDCGAAAPAFRRLDLASFPGVSMNASVRRFVWLPSGQLRGCSGEWVGDSVVIDLRDSRRAHQVTVSPGGEVSSR